MQMLTEETKNKWGKLLDECAGMDPIKDATVRNNTIRLLENTQKVLMSESDPAITADGHGTVGQGTTPSAKLFDPMLISMIRRTQPVLVGNQMLGVQPMSGPTGLIFAMRTHYDVGQGGTASEKAPYDDNIDTKEGFSGDGTSGSMTTAAAEALGVGSSSTSTGNTSGAAIAQDAPWKEMGFTIDKATVTVGSRALKARYTTELAQDLKAIHGLDAETELSTLLSNEIVGEIDRELVALLKSQAVETVADVEWNGAVIGLAAGTGTGGNAGEIFINHASTGGFDGRWSAEKAKQLIQFIGVQASKIALATRRGRGNFILCSADVGQYISEAGNMQYLNSDGSNLATADVANGPSFLGVLNGQYKVFIDPFMTTNQVVVGYKGANVYDAGAFYCPYVPMQFMRATGEEDFAPRIGFKTRYGLAANPYAVLSAQSGGAADLADVANSAAANPYYRTFTIMDL